MGGLPGEGTSQRALTPPAQCTHGDEERGLAKPRNRGASDCSSSARGALQSLCSALPARFPWWRHEGKRRAASWAGPELRRLASLGRTAIPPACSSSLSNRQLACLLLLWAAVVLAAIAGLSVTTLGSHRLEGGRYSRGLDTLVLYTYSSGNPEALNNLRFFVEHGMWETDGCEYLIIVQQAEEQADVMPSLPVLPRNAHYIRHNSRCTGWGPIGWALRSDVYDVKDYRLFVLMESSVRGPFLPAYWPKSVHWSRLFTSRLNETVKLVGSSISCESMFKNGDSWQPKRTVPHVQSDVVATDQAGLKVLLDDPKIFGCFENKYDKLWNSELGASSAIFAANYTIDSLMLRYQNVNWTDPQNTECNGLIAPDAEFGYDGIDVNPLEVVFVKVRQHMLEAEWSTQRMAVTYTSWLESQGAQGLLSNNDYAHLLRKYRIPRMFMMQLRGNACFDYEYYRSHSPDLRLKKDEALWRHYLEHGQFEIREARFTCRDRINRVGLAAGVAKQILTTPVVLPDLPAEETAELNQDLNEISELQQDEVKEMHRDIIAKIDEERERQREEELKSGKRKSAPQKLKLRRHDPPNGQE